MQAKDLEEADVKVGIGTIGNNDVLIRRFEQRFPKRYYTRWEGLRSFAAYTKSLNTCNRSVLSEINLPLRRKDCPGLEDSLEVFSAVEHEPER